MRSTIDLSRGSDPSIADKPCASLPVKFRERNRGDLGADEPPSGKWIPARRRQQDRMGVKASDDQRKNMLRRRVRPLNVLDKNDHGLFFSPAYDVFDECFDRALAADRWRLSFVNAASRCRE